LYGYQKAKSKDPDLTWWGYRSQKHDEDADFQYQNWKNSLPATYQIALDADKSAGYYPVEKNGKTYTRQYLPSNDVSGYSDGTDTDGVVYTPGA
jgi:hypothetical protein